jgi:Polyglycine hydrolase-like, structural repeat
MLGFVVASAVAGLSSTAPPVRPGWEVEVGLTAGQIRERTAARKALGYRPVCISAYNAGEANRFAVIYRGGAGPAWDLDWGLTPKQFQKRGQALTAAGFVPVCLSGCNLVGEERLSDLWLKQAGPARGWEYGLGAEGLRGRAEWLRDQGYRPVWLSSYMANAANAYALIWEKGGPTWDLKYGLSPEGLQEALDDLAGRGYRPVSISGHSVEGVTRYCAVWEKRKGPPWEARFGQTQEEFLELARAMASRGYRPVAVRGFNTLDGDRFVSIWEKE